MKHKIIYSSGAETYEIFLDNDKDYLILVERFASTNGKWSPPAISWRSGSIGFYNMDITNRLNFSEIAEAFQKANEIYNKWMNEYKCLIS